MPNEADIAPPEQQKLARTIDKLKPMLAAEYDRGFNDGLKFVISCLRRAADTVEKPTYSDFERKSGNGSPGGSIYRGVYRSGQLHFASQLRSVATEIESALKAVETPPDGTKT
jgi:hypothetical protein